MTRLDSPTVTVPALVLAEVVIPLFIWSEAVTEPGLRPTRLVGGLALVLTISYIIIEAIRHGSPIIGFGVGIWGSAIYTVPVYFVAVGRDMPVVTAATGILVCLALGAALGLVVALVAGVARPVGHESGSVPLRTVSAEYPPVRPGLVAAGLVVAALPLFNALALVRRLDLYGAWQHAGSWSRVSPGRYHVELAGQLLSLLAACALAGSFLTRSPRTRVLGVTCALVAALLSVVQVSNLAGLASHGIRALFVRRLAVDMFELGFNALALVVGLPWLLFSETARNLSAPLVSPAAGRVITGGD